MERLEDMIAEAVNGKSIIFEGECAYKYAEFQFGEIGGHITVNYDWHEDEDWQTFDWGRCLVQVEDVIDGIKDIELECWDDATGERVTIDEDYLVDRIDYD